MGFPPRSSYSIPLPGGRTLSLGERPLVMGILNLTADSFAESTRLVADGRVDVARAVELAVQMEAAGADLIDIGGESTRPGAEPLPAAEEAARVAPVVRALAARLRVPLSVDTYKADVATVALREGASILNDISGLRYEPALARVAADAGAGLVLMHTRGRSRAMYDYAQYRDVAAEVASELAESVRRAATAGVSLDRVIVDPGVGFAKRPADSYGVLARLQELALALDRPLLVGPSRKSYLCEALGEGPATARDWGTAAAVAAAVLGGAHIVRVHAVGEMVDVVRVAEAIRRHQNQSATSE